ncbi:MULTISPECIES: hypothetical protein [unclassified Acinetobacter]|uniref:hypothetical protein n=1 Tax=unclassified Acinetobacter TaxID=196816 RepID=UPI00244BF6EF|nr:MULTISPECIES: hypothetical protein [unclassified Acinetobacter]MDH0030992.1 hypothetical protein [Acinetobacter sp. GD04021]MDH0886564.1 hypothetical protein [Acinetobacter sp. GD03873]MDH1082998.1 hypothetical protein [Acinetobacter sp. GD03983]MDH2190041.1 hypothetical protein [Acinetobacter sp. GD03645]MDH2203177.1 hypothetical protein [Acinetobacter sp. GD03647]
MKKTFLVITLASLLTACGGSDNDHDSATPDNPNPPTQPNESKVGVFRNGEIVSGVHYQTSGGTQGDTNDKGEFNYKTGENIRFSLGNVQLGDEVSAKAVLTPVDLSEKTNVKENLVAFIQSLDSNTALAGIQVSDQTKNVLAGTPINFDQASTAFVQDSNVKKTIAESGTTLVDSETAKVNLRKAFYSDIAGVWQLSSTKAKEKTLVYVDANGNYVMGQASAKDAYGQAGIEIGNFNIDPITSHIKATASLDKNGEWGFAGSDTDIYLSYGEQKDSLLIREPSDNNARYTLTKVPNQENSLVGSWQMPNHIFTFFSDNSYFLLHTTEEDCAFNGLEYGKYSATNNTLKVSEIYYDTTGCAGLVDSYHPELVPGQYDLDSYTFTIKQNDSLAVQYENEEPAIFKRIK